MEDSERLTWTDFLVCPHDAYALQPNGLEMRCPVCERCFEIKDGVATMLLAYDDDAHRRYFENYQAMAREDPAEPFEGRRDARNDEFLRFIGDVQGKRVLDIGSGGAEYLAQMDATVKVAMDIALPYLSSIPESSGIWRVCADGEQLPVAHGFFDVIILSGVLEHVLAPEKLVARVHQACGPDTRIIVLVPWEEDLSPYQDLPWEFSHLRSFDSYSFSALWHQFSIVRRKAIWPRISDPILFRFDGLLHSRLFDLLRYGYFHRGWAAAEAELRSRWNRELPRRQRRLLLLYRPTFYEFELRTFTGSPVVRLFDWMSHISEYWAKIRTPT